jgi:hypothetical protein
LLGFATDFHLDPAAAVLIDPARKLFAQPLARIRREAAAAIDRHRVSRRAENIDERPAEALCFQVPERGIYRGDGVRADPARAEIAHRREHPLPGLADRERIGAGQQRCKDLVDQARRLRAGIGVAKAVRAAG